MDNLTSELTVCDVQKWVRDLFQDTEINIPELEENYDCMKLLSTIISINKEAEKDAHEIINTETYLADLYTKKNDEISNTLSSTLSMKDLQPDTFENTKRIASVAALLKLKEPTITNFLFSAAELNNKREEFIEQDIINGFMISKFSKKITDIMQKNESLQRDIALLEKKVSKQENFHILEERSKFMKIKAEEYKKRIERTEKHLKSLGWNSSLSHSELVMRSEAIQSFEHEVNNLAAKLESYENLPPNEVLTQFKIEEAQAELLRLEEEFDNLLKRVC